eukprot:m.159724 g.159724  ORF g.159724 m.159724 type:complete len:463 (+) comp9842_c0_seq2:195-1583(+)
MMRPAEGEFSTSMAPKQAKNKGRVNLNSVAAVVLIAITSLAWFLWSPASNIQSYVNVIVPLCVRALICRAASSGRIQTTVPVVVSVWSSTSAPTILERSVRSVDDLKTALQQDIVAANAHDGRIMASSQSLPASSKDAPILVFPVAELNAFLAKRSVTSDFRALHRIAGPSSQQILIWMLTGDRVVKTEDHRPARTFSALFGDFCRSTPERGAWQRPGALLFWTSPTFPPGLALDNFMVRGVQLSGNCFVHAPVVLQHYLVVKGSGHADHTKVAVSKYLQDNLVGSHLKEYLQGKGGRSKAVLVDIARLDSRDLLRISVSANRFYQRSDAVRIEQHLRDYGPALIAAFAVDSNFLEATQATATFRDKDFNYDATNASGLHAMVLLGIRPDVQEGHMCLVQNWHTGMELVEMSLPYLAAAGCELVFVEKPLTAIPAVLPQITAAFTEAMSDVGGEGALQEQGS